MFVKTISPSSYFIRNLPFFSSWIGSFIGLVVNWGSSTENRNQVTSGHNRQLLTLNKMANTSQKFRNFQSEPIGEKEVTAIAGIGDVLGSRLTEKGFDKAYTLLGQFLILKKDKEMFQEWLQEICHANSKQSGDCADCLAEYVKENL